MHYLSSFRSIKTKVYIILFTEHFLGVCETQDFVFAHLLFDVSVAMLEIRLLEFHTKKYFQNRFMVRHVFDLDYQRVVSLNLADGFHDHFHFGEYRNVCKTLELSWLFVAENYKAILISGNDPFQFVIH